jgi:hypothetical protein
MTILIINPAAKLHRAKGKKMQKQKRKGKKDPTFFCFAFVF